MVLCRTAWCLKLQKDACVADASVVCDVSRTMLRPVLLTPCRATGAGAATPSAALLLAVARAVVGLEGWVLFGRSGFAWGPRPSLIISSASVSSRWRSAWASRAIAGGRPGPLQGRTSSDLCPWPSRNTGGAVTCVVSVAAGHHGGRSVQSLHALCRPICCVN
jgi:hypothetical protein